MPSSPAELSTSLPAELFNERPTAAIASQESGSIENALLASDKAEQERSLNESDFYLLVNAEMFDANPPAAVELPEDGIDLEQLPGVFPGDLPAPLDSELPGSSDIGPPAQESAVDTMAHSVAAGTPPLPTAPLHQDLAEPEFAGPGKLDALPAGQPSIGPRQPPAAELPAGEPSLAKASAAQAAGLQMGASPTDASPNGVVPTDASPTDASPTGASPTDVVPSDASPLGNPVQSPSPPNRNATPGQQDSTHDKANLASQSARAASDSAATVAASAEQASAAEPSFIQNATAARSETSESDGRLSDQKRSNPYTRPLASNRVGNEKHTLTSVAEAAEQGPLTNSDRQSANALPTVRNSNQPTAAQVRFDELPEIRPVSDRRYGFQVDSPSMGRIWVQVKDGQRGLEARLETQSELAHQLLSTNLDTLRTHLETVGVELDGLSLGFRQGDHEPDGKMPSHDRGDESPPWTGEKTPVSATRRIQSIWNGKLNVLA